MKQQKFFVLCLFTFALIVAIAACKTPTNNVIVIGSKNFTEQLILGELLAQHIEAKTNLKVERRLNLGGTSAVHEAIKAGKVDAYVEYTGTSFTAILQHEPIADPQKVYQQVKQEYNQKFQLDLTKPLGFNDTYAIIIRGDDARKYKLKTISQLANKAPRWRAGFGYEFIERKDGFQGLAQTYKLRFAEPPRVMELGLMYRALQERQVDVIAGNSTDGLIERLNLVVLQDDRNYFPPYDAVPVVRQETLQKHPELGKALNQLGGVISANDMRRMNYLVDGEGREVKQLVREFLQSKGLVKRF